MTYEFDALIQVQFSSRGVGINVDIDRTLYYNLLVRGGENAHAAFKRGDSYYSAWMVGRRLVRMGMKPQDVRRYLNEVLVAGYWEPLSLTDIT